MGLDVDRDAILKAQKRQQQADALGLVESMGYSTPYEQSAGNIGALLGARLAKPEGLTPDQERKALAAEASNKRMEEWLRQNDKATPADREDTYMQFVSEEAFKYGLPEIGAQAAGAVDERAKLRKLQQIEMEAAGLKVPMMQDDRATTQQSRYKTIWNFGETNPNKGRRAYLDPATGDALAGPGGPVIAKSGEFTDNEPTRPDIFGRGGRGAGFGATPTEMGGVRDMHGALYRRGETLDEMRNVLEESLDNSGTLAATGNAGKLTAYVSRWANDVFNVMQVSGFGGDFTAVGKDGKPYSIDTVEGRRQLGAQYQATMEKYLPPEFRKNAELSRRWTALVTELLYLEARASEPGSKQFSDADIERMAAIVGANINSPGALSAIIMSSYDRAYSDLEYRMQMYPAAVRDVIVTDDSRTKLAEQRERVRARWAEPLIGEAKKEAAPMSDEDFINSILNTGQAPVVAPAQQTNPITTGSRGPQRRR
jgi:hypothetical protein